MTTKNERTGSDVDHTPGGSPVGKSASAPIYRTVNVRSELLGATEFSGTYVDSDHALSVCRAAAGMGMRNADRYGTEDRADAAADALSRMIARHGRRRECMHCGNGPAKHRATLLLLDSGFIADSPVALCTPCTDAAPTVSRRPVLDNGVIPADACTITHALNLVANYRRSLDAARLRDASDAAATVIEREFQASPELEISQRTTAPDAIGTPAGARATAVFLLRSCGLLSAAGHVETGPLWTLAYTMSRAAVIDRESGEMLGQSDVARELELTVNTHRSHLNRASKRLADLGFSANDWREALEISTPQGGRSGAASLPLLATANGEGKPDSVRDDWRSAPGQRVANTRNVIAAAPISQTQTEPNPSQEPAAWTGYLSPVTAARLARAAELRDLRSRAKSDAERDALKHAAGLK